MMQFEPLMELAVMSAICWRWVRRRRASGAWSTSSAGASRARGEAVGPSAYFFRTVMRFTTGAPALAWLNRTIAVSTGERRARQVLLQAFALI